MPIPETRPTRSLTAEEAEAADQLLDALDAHDGLTCLLHKAQSPLAESLRSRIVDAIDELRRGLLDVRESYQPYRADPRD